MKEIVLTITAFMLNWNAMGQVSRGIVLASENKEGIKYALVYKSDKSSGTYTDENGYFELGTKPFDTLIVQHVSFVTKKIIVSNTEENIQVILNERLIDLKEIVVTSKTRKEKIKEKYAVIECDDFSTSYALEIPSVTDKFLVGVSIYLSKSGISTAPFRVLLTKTLETDINVFQENAFEVSASKGQSWVDVIFNNRINNEKLYIVIERIVHPKFAYKEFKHNCNGIALGFSDVFDSTQVIQANSNNTGWYDLKRTRNGYNLMIKPIYK